MIDKAKVLEGRKAVDAYRTAHDNLYSGGWHKGIPEEHTPLLEKMLADLKEQGFNSLDEVFTASEELNIQELQSDADFQAKLTKANKDAKRYINDEGNEAIEDTLEAIRLKRGYLDRMWH